MGPVGVLALQGDFREHQRSLEAGGATVRLIRRPEELAGLSAIVLPGGESTTISRLATLYGLMDPLREVISDGLPAFGTCAGLIILASDAVVGGPPQLGVLDVVVARNAFGRQNDSFEADIAITGLDEAFHGVFIRAPQIAKAGPEVEELAVYDGQIVMVRQGNIIATSFHPELTNDLRIHEMLLDMREEH